MSTKGDNPVTNEQATVYRHLIGKMLFIGSMTAPLLLYPASMAASKISDLWTRHLRKPPVTLQRLKDQGAVLQLNSPQYRSSFNFVLDLLSDAATACDGETKVRSGSVIFRRYGDTVHPIQWTARRLRRVVRSSSTAEISAAA